MTRVIRMTRVTRMTRVARMARMRTLAALVLAAVVGPLAACADAGARPDGAGGGAPGPSPSTSPSDGPVNLVPPGYAGRFRVAAHVLESQLGGVLGPAHGPQLCLVVATSNPPQCDGPDVVGWSWPDVPHESVSGTRWGSYQLVGTFDGARFTMTEPATVAGADTPGVSNPAMPDFTSPCPEPAGGWRPVEVDNATDAAFEKARTVAAASPDFAGLWIDQDTSAGESGGVNDPTKFVLNVRFTRDLRTHEAELRRVWGGALCVSPARHTEAELRAIQDALTEPGVAASSVDTVGGRVNLTVWVAEADRQAELDRRYGAGTVRLMGVLEPLD
jgi:hypothetical protein